MNEIWQFLVFLETFHLLRIMMDDYFLYLVELLHIDDRARELMRNIALDVAPEYLDTDYEGFFSFIFHSMSVTFKNQS